MPAWQSVKTGTVHTSAGSWMFVYSYTPNSCPVVVLGSAQPCLSHSPPQNTLFNHLSACQLKLPSLGGELGDSQFLLPWVFYQMLMSHPILWQRKIQVIMKRMSLATFADMSAWLKWVSRQAALSQTQEQDEIGGIFPQYQEILGYVLRELILSPSGDYKPGPVIKKAW